MTTRDFASERPVASLLLTTSTHQPFGRLGRWLSNAFLELDLPFDVVYLEEPAGITEQGRVRTIRLGNHRSRASVPSIRRYLRASRPHFALSTPGHLSPFALIAGRLAGVTVVPWEPGILHYDLPTSRWPARALFYIERLGYLGAPLIATVADDVATHFAQRSFRDMKFFSLPNFVDAEELRISATENEPLASTASFRFCALGRLAEQKGYDIMLRAFGLAKGQLPANWELIVLGNGELHDRLSAITRAEGIAENVRFMGYVENPYPILSSADVFVHTARWEGCPVAVLEAVALGVPTIATNSPGGTRDILSNGAGVLVPPEDPSAFADALLAVAADEQRRHELSRSARARADEYSPARAAQRVIDLGAVLTDMRRQ